MVDFETVTFGGSNLDRVAHLRSDPEALAAEMTNQNAHSVVLWRGKPLMTGDEIKSLVRLPLTHPIFAQATEKPTLLGLEEGGLCFAQDVSQWEPEHQDLPDSGFLDPTEQHHPDVPADHMFQELRAVMASVNPRDAELAATARALFGWHSSHRFCSACGEKSEMVQAGWQRSCPACQTQHFPRTDPVVIMLITHGNNVLMGRSPGWPEGMYSLLAGFVEPGETPEAAVRREVLEEAGVQVGRVKYLGSQPWAFPSSLMIGCRGEALTTEINIDPNEIEEAFWVSREEMMEVFAGTHKKILPARKGAIAHFILLNWLADTLD